MTTEITARLEKLEKGHELMQKSLGDIDTRLKAVEDIGDDVAAIRGAIDKGLRQLRVWAPTIVAAAISAGIVNGKLGAFFNALFTGAN